MTRRACWILVILLALASPELDVRESVSDLEVRVR